MGKHKFKIITLFLSLVIAAFVASNGFNSNPFKITNPSNPKFNSEKFRLADYESIQEMMSVLPQIFKVGDSREYVELMLIERGRALIRSLPERPDEVLYVYDHPSPIQSFPLNREYRVLVQYNSQGRVVKMELNNSPILE